MLKEAPPTKEIFQKHRHMRTKFFIYIISMAFTCIAILLGFTTALYLSADAIMANPNGRIIAGISVGVSLILTRRLRPALRRITGVTENIQDKQDKFSKRYPIDSPAMPVQEVKHGDFLMINGHGKCTYSGKFMGKHVIIPSNGEEAFEMTTEELKAGCNKIWTDVGVKWAIQTQS